jgi:hypothetical protein
MRLRAAAPEPEREPWQIILISMKHFDGFRNL